MPTSCYGRLEGRGSSSGTWRRCGPRLVEGASAARRRRRRARCLRAARCGRRVRVGVAPVAAVGRRRAIPGKQERLPRGEDFEVPMSRTDRASALVFVSSRRPRSLGARDGRPVVASSSRSTSVSVIGTSRPAGVVVGTSATRCPPRSRRARRISGQPVVRHSPLYYNAASSHAGRRTSFNPTPLSPCLSLFCRTEIGDRAAGRAPASSAPIDTPRRAASAVQQLDLLLRRPANWPRSSAEHGDPPFCRAASDTAQLNFSASRRDGRA